MSGFSFGESTVWGGLRLTVGAQMGESVEFVEGQSFRNNNTANRQGYGASDPT